MSTENQLKVAVVTEKELSLVDDNLLNQRQLAFITAKTPKKFLKKRPAKGGGEWTYVTGAYIKKVLNLMFGWDWSFEVNEYKFDLNIKQAFVLGRLTVNTGEKSIVKMQFGRADIKFKTEWITNEEGKREKIVTDEPLDIGNDLKAASTDALKKCASELGIAADIYGKEEFKELMVVGSIDNPEDQRKFIEENLDLVRDHLSQEESMNIERILDQDEVRSYNKAVKLIKSIKL